MCSAEDECEWDCVDLCDVCVFSGNRLCPFPPSRTGPSYWSASLWLRHWLSDRISCVCVCVCACTSDVVSHRMLLLSPSFTPSVHGYSRRPQISFSCLCVCVKSNRGNLSEPNSVQMYRAECDNTLPWHLSTGWTSKHTIACALPRACSCSFLSPTKACASVSHGERQPRFDNLFMGWKKKTICAWWDDRDLMFVEGATE